MIQSLKMKVVLALLLLPICAVHAQSEVGDEVIKRPLKLPVQLPSQLPPVTPIVSGVVSAVPPIVGGVLTGVAPVVTGVVSGVTGVATGVVSGVQNVISSVPLTPVTNVVGTVTHLPVVTGLTQQLGNLGLLPGGSGHGIPEVFDPIRDLLGSVIRNPHSPSGMPLPQALQELMVGVGPELRCANDQRCFLQANYGETSADAFAIGCAFVTGNAVDFAFGAIPGHQKAAKWAVDSSVAIECAPGIKFRLVLQSNGAATDASSTEIDIGDKHAILELRSNGMLIAEKEFISEGGLQVIPVTGLLTDAMHRELTPSAAGKAVVTQSPRLALQSYQ